MAELAEAVVLPEEPLGVVEVMGTGRAVEEVAGLYVVAAVFVAELVGAAAVVVLAAVAVTLDLAGVEDAVAEDFTVLVEAVAAEVFTGALEAVLTCAEVEDFTAEAEVTADVAAVVVVVEAAAVVVEVVAEVVVVVTGGGPSAPKCTVTASVFSDSVASFSHCASVPMK